MINFLFALIELFSLSITVPELWGKMCTARLFLQRDRPLCTQILPGQGCPYTNHSWRQKTRDTGLPEGEDRIPLHFLVLTQYRSVTDRRTDIRQTYGRTDLPCHIQR